MISAAELILACEKCHLLAPARVDELRPRLRSFADAKTLARELLNRGWLTPYQANQLLTGRGQDLLLGSYVLLERIGEGGMGTVFKAHNWKLDRVCALKVIRKEKLTSDDAIRRFAREIEIAGQLNHLNVVRAYDAGESHGAHFIVMEYVAGVNLSKMVKDQGPVQPSLACEYIRQAALGLQHAHERGLVHRDIKPGNLLLAHAEGVATVKVLDMGLARIAGDDNDDVTSLTDTGALVGTIDYMSPEQSKSAHTVDVRSDLYSLGCAFYYLLVGKAPFAGGSSAEKLLKHQIEHPKRIEEIRPDVPAVITDVVHKLLAKKPEDRFQTAAELAEHLRVVLANKHLWTTAAPVAEFVHPPSGSSSVTAPLTKPISATVASDATVVQRNADARPAPVTFFALAGSVVALVLLGLLLNWTGVFSRTPEKPPVPPPPVIDPVIAMEGELTREDRPDPYREKVLKVSSPHRVHNVKLEAGKSYRIDLQSNYFDTYLRVENAEGLCLAVDDDGGENKNSQVNFVATENAPYKLIVTSTQGTGPYTLKLTPSPALFIQNGKLTDFEQTFTVNLSPGTRYAVDLVSKDFDAFLRIENAKGDLIDESDTGGVQRNARLFIEPPQAGDYKIVATSRDSSGRGNYTLSVAAAGKAPIPTPLGGGPVQGQLLPSDLPDKVRAQPCKIYSFPMSAGKLYQIDLEAIAFDPYLRLESPNGKHLTADDDSGEGLCAQINFTPPRDGIYRIVATSYSTAGTGHFTLRVSTLSSKLVMDVYGMLGKKDVTHKVTMKAGSRYVIETLSTAFDSVVTLKNSNGVDIARDDDSGGDRNARLTHICALAGEYQIVVSAYTATERGPYRLIVRELTPERK